MIKKFNKITVPLMAVTLVIVGTVVGGKLKAHNINNIFYPHVLEDRIEETIPDKANNTQVNTFNKLAEKFVNNIVVREDLEVKATGMNYVKIDGNKTYLKDDVYIDKKGELYISVKDSSTLLKNYLASSNLKNLFTKDNIEKAYELAKRDINSVIVEGRVYVPIVFISEKLDIEVSFKSNGLVVNTSKITGK